MMHMKQYPDSLDMSFGVPSIFRDMLSDMDSFNRRGKGHNKNKIYPPYNIIKNTEENYDLTIAVAGFQENDLSVSSDSKNLYIKGEKQEENDVQYVVKHIAMRSFYLTFPFGSDMAYINDVVLENGLLKINFTVKDVNSENNQGFNIRVKN